MAEKKHPIIYCSFCKKSSEEVAHVIAGPQVHICNSCVDVCREILVKDFPDYEELDEVQDVEVTSETMKVSDVIALVSQYHFNTRVRLKFKA